MRALQAEFGYIDSAAGPLVARALNLSHADVHGVIRFYHDFRRTPRSRHVLRSCRAEACQAMGSEALASRLTRRLGIEWKETSRDGAVTIEPVYCLGNCALSPAAMLDGKPYGRVSPQVADFLIDSARRHA